MLVAAAMHIALTAVFLVWAGSKASIVDLPSSTTILLVLVIAAAIIGLAVVIRPARRLIRTVVVPQVEKAVRELREALRDPARLSLSFLGALLMGLASAAPTPGGVGAVEAAPIAGLTATGAPNEQAVPAVLVYRVATFWLPVLPGWLAFTLLTRRDVI